MGGGLIFCQAPPPPGSLPGAPSQGPQDPQAPLSVLIHIVEAPKVSCAPRDAELWMEGVQWESANVCRCSHMHSTGLVPTHDCTHTHTHTHVHTGFETLKQAQTSNVTSGNLCLKTNCSSAKCGLSPQAWGDEIWTLGRGKRTPF